ncbi:MAG: pseudouridine synthase [Thermodesulfobacteriota bacterium]
MNCYEPGIRIIYEDSDLILVDKPSGVPSHMLKPDETGTVVNFLIHHDPGIRGVGSGLLMSGLAHRLDTDTSGILLAVKNESAFHNIREQFKEMRLYKAYQTLVHGRYEGPFLISTWIGSDPKKKKKVKVYSHPFRSARPAVTRILKRRYYSGYTYLTLIIRTGVRHQIRAHLSGMGHPVVGDLLYQNSLEKKKDQLGLKRQFLHAFQVGFFHPRTGEWVEFTCNLPQDLREALACLRRKTPD